MVKNLQMTELLCGSRRQKHGDWSVIIAVNSAKCIFTINEAFFVLKNAFNLLVNFHYKLKIINVLIMLILGKKFLHIHYCHQLQDKYFNNKKTILASSCTICKLIQLLI